MLARNTAGVAVLPNTETEICQWTSDGAKYLAGFHATGTYSAEFRLYVGEGQPWYVDQTSPSRRTAYVADRAEKIPAGTVISLRVFHEAASTETFKGTILGS